MNTKRQPIVTVLGHVDHGKTSLLDALRKSSVVNTEAGGITQSIGASVVETKNGDKITFIDTPGHALFSGMRQRGATAADIALLIVDGSSSVKPQTKEAIEIINNTKLPFIVVVTKIDLPSASVEKVLEDLEKEGIYFEGRGGQVPYVGVSARNKTNLEQLIDLIVLLSEVNGISGNDAEKLLAFVIETSKEKGGITVSVVVKSGLLKVGTNLFSTKAKGKVKGLFNHLNQPVKEVHSGEPARILGFEGIPEVGGEVKDIEVGTTSEVAKRSFVRHDKTKIPLYLKASSQGSLEALIASIPQEFVIVDSTVGDVTESDILNAKANNASIFIFESGVSNSVKKLADAEGVDLESFNIIYELLERLDEITKKGQSVIFGKAEVLASFPFDGKRVAGSKVTQGTISKNNNIILLRGEVEVGRSKISSVRKQKNEVNSVSQGEECGIFIIPQLDFKEGDVIVAVKE